MRKAFFILTSLVIIGCTTTPVATSPEHTEVIKPIQEVVEPELKTSIFTYYVDPVNQAQPMAIVRGSFLWKDGCIYLVDNAGEYSTAMFPSLPKDVVKWDEATKTLNLGNKIFKMGDYVVTNGGSKPYLPNTESAAELESQGDKKCLTPWLTMIGTSSLN